MNAQYGIPLVQPMTVEDVMVGSLHRLVADQALEALVESLRRKVNAAAEDYNCISKTFQSNLMIF